jgi:hypothetical protein
MSRKQTVYENRGLCQETETNGIRKLYEPSPVLTLFVGRIEELNITFTTKVPVQSTMNCILGKYHCMHTCIQYDTNITFRIKQILVIYLVYIPGLGRLIINTKYILGIYHVKTVTFSVFR